MVLPEHEQRFRRMVSEYVERPGGNYAELLDRGQASSPDGVDPEQWRREIRGHARQDKIRVVTCRDASRAFAMLNPLLSDERAMTLMREAATRGPVLQRIVEAAGQLGHEPVGWLRSDDSTSRCASAARPASTCGSTPRP